MVIASGVSDLHNTLVHGVYVGLSLQKPYIAVGVPEDTL